MRKIMLILLPLCILYFPVGAILIWIKVIEQQTYLSGAGIVGGIASVLGLGSFLRPALTRSDILNIEAESLKALGEMSSKIKKLEKTRSQTATQINDIETQKREMELLVRKASLSLFLKEQYDHQKKSILDHLKKEQKLQTALSELSAVDRKLAALDEEIEKDENVELLRKIINDARINPSPLDTAIKNAPPFTRFFLQIVKAYAQVFQRAFRPYLND